MFTGIVQSQGIVIALNLRDNFLQLTIEVDKSFISHLEKGASVANNGVCLTVTDFGERAENKAFICFDVIDETLRVTNMSQLSVGSRLNIERSLKVGDELGGHIISGHVHTRSTLVERIDKKDNCQLKFSCPAQLCKFVMAKGFIALNGISLTVGDVDKESFWVHLIPETLQRTNLANFVIGDQANIEFDQQTITIVNTLEKMKLTTLERVDLC